MIKLLVIIALGLFMIPLLAFAQTKVEISTIEPAKAHEVCMTLNEGQFLRYSFKSTKSLNFNIHYHEGKKVIFPVEQYLTDGADENFKSTLQHGYCMMWFNPNEDAIELKVEYEIN